MSLSIGVITVHPEQYLSHTDIAELASHAKHHAKNIVGNSLFIERRVQNVFPASSKLVEYEGLS